MSAAEIDWLSGVFKREREMELVLLRERHRKARKAAERLGEARSMEGLGAPTIECDPWLMNYLSAVIGPRWFEDKTARRMLKNELPEIFQKPKGTKIQSGYRG